MELPKELEGKAYISTKGNIRYLECIDCGEPKTKAGAKRPRCLPCGAKARQAKWDKGSDRRTCKVCEEDKPMTTDYFYRSSTGTLARTCISCVRKKQSITQRKRRTTDEYKKKRREYQKARRMNEPEYRLRRNVSRTINAAIRKGKGTKKGSSILAHLPYSIAELKEHLESQFEAGMSWENWGVGEGKWNIDHIYPQSKLPYDSMEHPNFQKSWCLSNLRPCWDSENKSKGSKTISELLP